MLDGKDGRKVTGPVVTMDLAKAEGWYDKNGSKWKTMPQMMLRYRAASFFGRMNCPDLMMGMYTREEVEEFGREEYLENMQTEVETEIASNANSVPFEEIEEKPAPQTMPKAQEKEKEPVKVEGEQDLPDFMKAEG